MTVAFQRMLGILERWNNNQVTPSLSKPHELSYRFNIILFIFRFILKIKSNELICQPNMSFVLFQNSSQKYSLLWKNVRGAKVLFFDTRVRNAILCPWCGIVKIIVSMIDDESV